MKSNKVIKEVTHLELDKDEAKWLMGLMQNPIHVTDPNAESFKDKEMRKKFWQVLGGR